MHAIIFIPGITGTRLSLAGSEIWPPDLFDLAFNYKKIAKLLDPNAVPTGIIDTVILPCAQIYKPIEDDFADICAQINAQYVVFPYDWRQDLISTASALAARLQDLLVSAPAIDNITLVAHSMGGLVARLLLESGTYSKSKWFTKIKRLLCICSPHLGAPKALSLCMGLEDDETIRRSDVKRLCSDERYRSAYQLLPAPNNHHVTLWDVTTGTEIPLDFYQSGVATRIGLDKANLDAAKVAFGKLNFANRPPKVEYRFIVGIGHPTEEGVDVTFSSGRVTGQPKQDNQGGDGTVPIWSAGYIGVGSGIKPPWQIPGDHVGILSSSGFRQKLYSYFGLTAPPSYYADKPTASISLNKRVYFPKEEMHLLIIPGEETDNITGSLTLTRLSNTKSPLLAYGPEHDLVYRGGQTSFISMKMNAPALPGAYRYALSGTHITTDMTAGWFAVSPTALTGHGVSLPVPRSRRAKQTHRRRRRTARAAK